MQSKINHCINNKKRAQITYGGHKRVIEIHAYGVNEKGNRLIHAYQLSGGSSSGKKEEWKHFNVSRIKSFIPLNDNADAPREGYSENSHDLEKVLNQVST